MAFATNSDVATRLGRSLTTVEEAMADQLLLGAQAAIEVVVGREEADFTDDVPQTLKSTCIALVCRAMANPSGLSSQSESIGAFSHSENFSKASPGEFELTKVETLLVRKAVWGTNTGSAKMNATLIEEALDELIGS